MATLDDIFAQQSSHQDSMLHAFEQHLHQIVLRAQAKVISSLQSDLSIDNGIIEMSAANYRILRGLNTMFMDAMEAEGYSALVEAFVGEFNGTLQFLDETLAFLSAELKTPLPLANLRKDPVLATFKLTAVDALEDAVRGVAGAAMQRSMLSVGGLKFSTLVETLTDKFETTIAKARTLADTSMSTFYRTATDRAFRAIEKDQKQETRYIYAGPDDKLTRPFCQRLVESGKSYTRAEIDRMNNGQLPNTFLTGGGWNCRHSWLMDISEYETRAAEAA
jgi:hypothetical protein